MKVFCDKCKFYRLLISKIGTCFVCGFEGITKDIWGNKVGVPCTSKNSEFNCKDFKEVEEL